MIEFFYGMLAGSWVTFLTVFVIAVIAKKRGDRA